MKGDDARAAEDAMTLVEKKRGVQGEEEEEEEEEGGRGRGERRSEE